MEAIDYVRGYVMDKLIPAFIIIGIIILGFIMKRIELSDIIKRVEFTNSYRHKFIELINGFMSRNCFNQQLYYELTSDVKSMQYELGSDGIFAYVTDNLRGFSTSNYQLLVNFLPELRNAINERDNGIIMNRINQSAQDCDDMFIRHLGTLKEAEKASDDLEDFSFASKGFSLDEDTREDIKVSKETEIDENSKETAKKFLEDIFSTLAIDASIDISEKDGCLCISVEGDDASRLIGRRGESLDSLQMLLGLAVNRDRDKYVKVLLDIENYRAKREESLIKYANKMARQAAKQRRVIKLEPMNPYERRIIHSALQSDRYVKTYSEGKDPYRKIVIEPKYK